MSYKIKEEIQIPESREGRRRGRPRGNPKPLNEEEKRRRNAEYERERRAITSEYINTLGAMLGLKPRTKTETIALEAIRALAAFKNQELEQTQKIQQLEYENSVLKSKAGHSRKRETIVDKIKVIDTSSIPSKSATSSCEPTYWVEPTTSSSELSPSCSEPSPSRSEPCTAALCEYTTSTHLPTSCEGSLVSHSEILLPASTSSENKIASNFGTNEAVPLNLGIHSFEQLFETLKENIDPGFGIDNNCQDEEIGINSSRNKGLIENEVLESIFEIDNFSTFEEMFEKSYQESKRSESNDETIPTNGLYNTSTLNWL